jgi:5-methylcytosine-specific restriction enzyme A
VTDYKHLYDSRRWRRRAALQLRHFPLCQMCEAEGIVREARAAHHVTAHKGDEQLFWFGALASLCPQHHDGTMQQIERNGFARDIGPSGWPIDQRHPVYVKK